MNGKTNACNVPFRSYTSKGAKQCHGQTRFSCCFRYFEQRPPLSAGCVASIEKRFLDQHEERTVEEQRFLRESAEEKYRRTHDYNIIAGNFYDKNKEREFVESREKLEAMQGQAQQYRFPPSMRYGEGNDFNIINQQVWMLMSSACVSRHRDSSNEMVERKGRWGSRPLRFVQLNELSLFVPPLSIVLTF